ncbi:hypothetical protein [Mucilaginibacter psychrotolerans]|uniref:hypothetical protein n=1 Tax=Mucilaginibacter psychrotolerans TaxID=1524096 RepID=UPI0013051B64|nr:hypothetical protein [Mucilaginibacter psychrotolerans]
MFCFALSTISLRSYGLTTTGTARVTTGVLIGATVHVAELPNAGTATNTLG